MEPFFIEEESVNKTPTKKSKIDVQDIPTPPSTNENFLATIKKFAHPSSLKEGRLVDRNDTDLEIPRAFKLHRNNIELQQMREWRQNGSMVRMRLNKQQLRYVWQSQYGYAASSFCMCCKVTPINWDSVMVNASHVVSDAQLGNPDKPWNFLYLCGDCNQKGAARAKNAFDQIAEFRIDRVFMYVETLMRMYFETEVIDYSFKGREDFVRQVYGDSSLDHFGGIESRKVFELLRKWDEKFPLPRHELNPFLKALSETKKTSFIDEIKVTENE